MQSIVWSLWIDRRGRSDDRVTMEDKAKSGLQHIPTGTALSLHSTRSSIIARGRRDAANAASNPHYRKAVTDYNADNFGEAAAAFRLAAEQGHAESQYLLSTMYDEGKGLPKDDTQAAYWERKAAEQGHAYAQANLSFRYYAANDFIEAFAWCQRAAYSQLAWAQYNLGLMYRKGEGVAQSNTEAAYWYRLAAAQNFPEAQQKLAELYYFGQGVPRSDTQAATWYRRAAENGDAEAQFQLGHLYAIGQGVEHDYTQSRHWIRQAAQQGHEQAIRELKRREYRDP
jgi:TPR repeat protein